MHDDTEAIEAERLDADIEMAELQRAGQEADRMRRQGKCPHGWRQGVPSAGTWPPPFAVESRKRGSFPDRPTNWEKPAPGFVLCLDCGQHVPY